MQGLEGAMWIWSGEELWGRSCQCGDPSGSPPEGLGQIAMVAGESQGGGGCGVCVPPGRWLLLTVCWEPWQGFRLRDSPSDSGLRAPGLRVEPPSAEARGRLARGHGGIPGRPVMAPGGRRAQVKVRGGAGGSGLGVGRKGRDGRASCPSGLALPSGGGGSLPGRWSRTGLWEEEGPGAPVQRRRSAPRGGGGTGPNRHPRPSPAWVVCLPLLAA